ncbi:hypothetical protein JMM81_13745 [Bacillus sp. V3B]|uniref:hypothetical protein n=1 Tax=Bacillus sp. V3B TaxID=2804915 RepID=UPI00210B47E8|nr:hypothetical protein [Bacillus sp. V3B]MCQ6276002.1 hypothetical protein [Bacillus sp. V3B]
MKTRTYFSVRVYKDTLSKEYIEAITHALLVFNRAKQFAFSTTTKENRSGKNKRSKSMHLTVKSRFNLDDYYANSAVQEANAIQKSLAELNKLYITNKEEQIKSVKNKIKKEKSRLKTLTKMKQSFVNGKPSFPKNSNIKNHILGSDPIAWYVDFDYLSFGSIFSHMEYIYRQISNSHSTVEKNMA